MNKILWTHRTSFTAFIGNHIRSSKGEILQSVIVWDKVHLLKTQSGMGEQRCLDSPWSPWAAAGLSKQVFVQKLWISSHIDFFSVTLLPHIFWTLTYLEALPK